MNNLPLPESYQSLLDLEGAANRSLVFDRGFDHYDRDWRVDRAEEAGGEGKRAFLHAFCEKFAKPPGFEEVLERRHQVFEACGVRSWTLRTATRLIVGLGLPHPVETGFLLDRLTGCPYLPGSSVKGLLRAAARLVAAGELPVPNAPSDAQAFFHRHLDRLFGPELGREAVAAKGELVVYDAFPPHWPKLELDVLTPHQGDYYTGNGATPPADWHDPVPVTFLAVPAATAFRFYLGSRAAEGADEDLEQVGALLAVALEWLGAGAKTRAGYGLFEPPRNGERPVTETWEGARLTWVPNRDELEASTPSNKARGKGKALLAGLPETIQNKVFKNRNPPACTVTVRRQGESWFEIVEVRLAGEGGA